MSLNEIVNCPSQFASNNPYLVVQHIDWIQCRYLFVQTSGDQAKNNQRRYGSPPFREYIGIVRFLATLSVDLRSSPSWTLDKQNIWLTFIAN